MNIAMLSDLEIEGGAAVAASRLATGFCRAGHKVTRLVASPSARKHAWTTYPLKPSHPFRNQIIRKLLPPGSRSQWDENRAHKILRDALAEIKPDVINVHNLHWASWLGWSPQLIEICLAQAPTVWTLHDMWSFTGRCANNAGCSKYLTGCDAACPTPTEYPPLHPDQIAGAWNMRRDLFQSHSTLSAVTPSRWLAEEARRGLWNNHRIEVIANGLPMDVFQLIARNVAREALGVRAHGPVLLMVAQTLTDKRKGGPQLLEALQIIKSRPVTLLTLGHGVLPVDIEGVHLQSLGYIDHERTLALAYSAADIFIQPSLGENLPNVIAESFACGTPTIGFPVGGIPEMIHPGKTGWLATDTTAAALATALDAALTELNRGVDLRLECRCFAEAEYKLETQTDRYLKWFAELMRSSKITP